MHCSILTPPKQQVVEWNIVGCNDNVELEEVEFDEDVEWKQDIEIESDDSNLNDILFKHFFHVLKDMPN